MSRKKIFARIWLKKENLYMKATGIVRRIDDLGRVVIPKEIRRTMRIREGDPLEIYTDREGEVIFKKYSPIGELTNFASQYADTLHKVCTMDVIICDRDAVIACAGVSKKEYLERSLSPEFEKLMESRGLYTHHDDDEALLPLGEGYAHFVSCAMPIMSNGDIIGCVASLKSLDGYGRNDLTGEVEVRLVTTAASFLGRQLEE